MNKTALRILRRLPDATIGAHDADAIVFACSRAASLMEKLEPFTLHDAEENVIRWLDKHA